MTTNDRPTRRPPRTADDSRLCAHCGDTLSAESDGLLLRRRDWLPENTDAVLVHRDCADAFARTRDGSWQSYEPVSAAGLWLLPLTDGPAARPITPRRSAPARRS